jgi:hypothetical protein
MHNVGLDAYLEGPAVLVIDAFALTEPLLDNFKAAKKTVCRLTPDATKAFSDKARGVWEIFGKRSAANKAVLDQVLAAKKDFAAKKK